MKITWFRTLIKIWIAITSVAAFLAGWVFLGHSGKPVSANSDTTSQPPAQVAPLPTLEPLPSLDSNSTGIQPLPQQQMPSFSFSPRMRTRGS